MILRTAGPGELDARTLYALLRLRVDVFVVEQRAAYPELDGHDLEPGTRHCWLEEREGPVSYLRILPTADGGSRIGRVVTAATHRGQGHSARLMAHAIELSRPPVTLHAQAHLQGWYERFRFEVTGPVFTFDDDPIPHVPMRLA